MDGTTKTCGLRATSDDDWERTFDAVPDLILILDTQHQVIRANRAIARRLGRSPDELVGLKCYELVHGTQSPPMVCPHERMLANGQEQCVEIKDDFFGGTFLVSVSPLYDADGMTSGSVHVARDISRQKEAEREARQAASQREHFLAMLSHELRNPLGAILNAAYVVKRVSTGDGPSREALAVIERQARQMSHLLDDLLDVSRVMQGKIELRQESVDIAAAVDSAVKVVQPSLDERDQQLHQHVAGGCLTVQGDTTRLQQVIVNLLMNAIKYTNHGGQIWIEAKAVDDEVVIGVRDNGRGISPDAIDDIFELFVQADESLDRREGGMGIGLTLVRMLVEMHQGQVLVSSDGLGKGSEFVVRLPGHSERGDTNDREAGNRTPPDATRILLIEDNADSRLMMKALLELDGHKVAVAEDGEAGLAALVNEAFDLALIDIGLPGLDGYELVRRYRSQAPPRRPVLVALTGYGRASDREAVLEAGFDEHLVKPCDPEKLDGILRRPRKRMTPE